MIKDKEADFVEIFPSTTSAASFYKREGRQTNMHILASTEASKTQPEEYAGNKGPELSTIQLGTTWTFTTPHALTNELSLLSAIPVQSQSGEYQGPRESDEPELFITAEDPGDKPNAAKVLAWILERKKQGPLPISEEVWKEHWRLTVEQGIELE